MVICFRQPKTNGEIVFSRTWLMDSILSVRRLCRFVSSQQRIACLRGCAVFFGVAALLSQSVAVTKIFVYIFSRKLALHLP
ncbi:Uncharacterised protein [Neisseria meningitidis]|nr:Uncharacterised protein [Neisseria meningitidis]